MSFFSFCASPFFLISFVRLPPLKKCQIFSKELVDPLMVGTYTRLPKLPKYVLYVILYNYESLTIIILGWQISLPHGVLLVSKAVTCCPKFSLYINRLI